MNESPSTEHPQDFPGRRIAVLLGAALLIGLTFTLGLVLWDNSRRAALEVIVESTAVGDTRYLAIPEPPPPEPFPAVAQLDGRSLVPTGYKRHEQREVEMHAVAKDGATGLTIYREAPKKKEVSKPDHYYLKAGPGEFIQVRPADAAQ
jgi:hypothetical protein